METFEWQVKIQYVATCLSKQKLIALGNYFFDILRENCEWTKANKLVNDFQTTSNCKFQSLMQVK